MAVACLDEIILDIYIFLCALMDHSDAYHALFSDIKPSITSPVCTYIPILFLYISTSTDWIPPVGFLIFEAQVGSESLHPV